MESIQRLDHCPLSTPHVEHRTAQLAEVEERGRRKKEQKEGEERRRRKKFVRRNEIRISEVG